MVALTIPGIEVGSWQVRHRADPAAIALANRHYSREIANDKQVGGPSFLLVLVSPCEQALWITARHSPETRSARVLADGFLGYRCAMFRNEGAGRSSDLILDAMDVTERLWGNADKGWMTYVARDKVRSVNPGSCFKRAGWTLDRDFDHPSLVRLSVR